MGEQPAGVLALGVACAILLGAFGVVVRGVVALWPVLVGGAR